MANQTLQEVRQEKLLMIAKESNPYPERYETTHELYCIAGLEDGTDDISIAGRILSIRKMGKLTFVILSDIQGKAQIVLKENVVGIDSYMFFHSVFDIGDFIGAYGEVFTTKTGEKTINTKHFTFLGKALLPLPEKYHGVQNVEICYRQRYLDLIMNDETRDRFIKKTNFIKAVRRFLEDKGYMEIETPVLINKPSGALAKPFKSHHNALDMDVFLRIAPETYLKRAIVGGYTKIFEFARCFRNEGMDAVHLQDFTMLECYCAFYNYKDNMRFIQEMLCTAVEAVYGNTVIEADGCMIDFKAKWPIVTFSELILKDCGIDIKKFNTTEGLLAEIRKNKIVLEGLEDITAISVGTLIDLLYKKVSRPFIKEPVFLTEHPLSLSPLARANDNDPQITDRFQLVINGAEVINAYSELVDPVEQQKRLTQQAALNKNGDEEAMQMDMDYINAMKYGMPPISGWGMGIDRIMQILTGQKNLRDTVLFPLMRPVDLLL